MSEFEIIEKVRSCQIAPLSQHNATIPKKVSDIVLKTLERDPEKRYQNAEELYNDLLSYLDDQRTYLGPSDLRNHMRERFGEEIQQEEMEIQREAGLVRAHEKNRIREEIRGAQAGGSSTGKGLRRIVPRLRGTLLRAGGVGILLLAAYGLMTLSSIHERLSGKKAKVSEGPSASVAVDKRASFLQSTINEASLLLTEKDYAGAIARFDQVWSVDPQFAGQYDRLSSKAFLARGRRNRDKSSSSALEDFRRACRMDPSNFEAYFELGRLLTKMKRYGEARLSYQKAIEINPDFPDTHFNLELSCFRMGERARALKAFKNALTLDPKNRRTIDFIKRLDKSRGR